MVSHKNTPIKYPRMPPNTENIVVINANLIHFKGFERAIGNSNKSGGMGKKELSAKATKARNFSALGLADSSRMVL